MGKKYVSIETNIKAFEFYKELWGKREITGVMATTMAEGIAAVVAIEQSETDDLYFIDIVSDDINYMPQLANLNSHTSAPILIATSKYNADEHHEALENGAFFYGEYNIDPTKNINAVNINVMNYHQEKTPLTPLDVLFYKGILIFVSDYKAFYNDVKLDMTLQDFKLLCYLVKYRERTLTYDAIYRNVWGSGYEGTAKNLLWDAVKRLRGKIETASGGLDFIETIKNVGYCFTLKNGD
jgi:DNA-binding response OmpR family regulator